MKKPLILFGSLAGFTLVISGLATKAQSPPLRAAAQTASGAGAYQRFVPIAPAARESHRSSVVWCICARHENWPALPYLRWLS
jgi:hypothetical protein